MLHSYSPTILPHSIFLSSLNSTQPSYYLLHKAPFTKFTPLLLNSPHSSNTQRSLIQFCSSHIDLVLHDETAILCSYLAELGLDEKEIGVVLTRNSALKLATFESVGARVFSLRSAGIKEFELYQLIKKFPSLLTAEEIDSLLRFVLNDLPGRIEPAQLKRLLATTDLRFLAGFERRVLLLLDHGVPEDKIVHVLNNVNLTKALCLKSVEEIDRTLAFLSRFGGVEIIVKRPRILNSDLDTQLIPRILFIKELSGGDEEATGNLLRKLPAILSYSKEYTEGQVEVLRSLAGLSDAEIFRIFFIFPNLISASKERKLRPRIEFLKQCGLNSEEIYKFLTKAPLFLALSCADNLSHKLVFLVKMGYEHKTKELAAAMGAITRTNTENLQKVVGLFFSYGLCCADILTMSKRHPPVLQYRYDSLRAKMEYLIEEMGRDVGELLAFPAFLGYNLDSRIKQRYEAKKESRGEGMSLNKLLTVSYDRFSGKKKKKDPIPDQKAK